MQRVCTHEQFSENRGMGVERVPSACDTVAPAITFPIGYFLIQGKECAVVERAWVLLLRLT